MCLVHSAIIGFLSYRRRLLCRHSAQVTILLEDALFFNVFFDMIFFLLLTDKNRDRVFTMFAIESAH